MRFLHTMARVSDLDKSLAFYRGKLGLEEVRRMNSQQARLTLVFLAAPGDSTRHFWSSPTIGTGRTTGQGATSATGRSRSRTLPKAVRRRYRHQTFAPGRPHGLHTLCRPDLDRESTERRRFAATRALGLDDQFRDVVALGIMAFQEPAFWQNFSL